MYFTNVKSVTDDIRDELKQLREENEKLKTACCKLEVRVAKAEAANDSLEQYSRRNSVRISGIPVEENEDTDKIVLELADTMDVSLNISNLDRTHRIGPTKKRKRDIIVKFATYRARQKLITERKKLRDMPDLDTVYINEDLTMARSKLLYDARRLVKAKLLKSAYSSDGRIFVKDNTDKRYLIQSDSDIEKHGHLDEPMPNNTSNAGFGAGAVGSDNQMN